MVSFEELDDKFLAAEITLSNFRSMFVENQFSEIGPFVEFLISTVGDSSLRESIKTLMPQRLASDFSRGFSDSKRHTNLDVNSPQCEFLIEEAGQDSDIDQIFKVAFVKRLENAARYAGINRRLSSAIAHGFIEMSDNISEHAQSRKFSVHGFQAKKGFFEYVVADDGEGILQTLSRCREYEYLDDHSDALELALQDGISSFGTASGRGTGFRYVLLKLTDFGGNWRFRTGDCSLELDGLEPNLVTATISQRPSIRGFLVSFQMKTLVLDS